MSETNPGAASALASFSDALADAVASVAKSVVAVHARRRIPASGVVWRQGYVVASDHTLRRETGITVSLDDGRSLDASVVGRDPGTDLALLRIVDETVPAATRGDDATLRPGQIILAVGRPGNEVTATLGAVHTVGDEWRTWQGGHLARHIRLDVAIHDGFSGSALIDAHGRVVGINSSMLARGAPATIPAVTVDRVVDQLLTGGRVARGWLGIGSQPLPIPEKVRTEAQLSLDVGLLIVAVAADSPAERAGLHVGDMLIALAGTPTRAAEDVLAILGSDTVGRTLTARVVRAGALVEIPVVIGESPHRAGPTGHGPRPHFDPEVFAFGFRRGRR